jgi:Protein of unknown function (DUF4232)
MGLHRAGRDAGGAARDRPPAEKVTPMSVARSRAATAALGAAGLAVLLTACTGGHPAAGGKPAGSARTGPSHVTRFVPPSQTSPTPVSASTEPSGPTPSGSAQPPATTAAAGPPTCTTGSLQVTVGPANGTAGSIYYPLLFTNTSPVTCTMYGYPGVTLVSQPGRSALGPPAVRNATFPKELVTLAPGAVAHASLQVALAQNYPASRCKPATGHWLQVYPPGEYAALFVAFTVQTCTSRVGDGSTLGIYVVRPGATGP